MVGIVFRFNPEKAIEAIIYLASKVSKPDLYDICKLLYIVDKASLERYGRFVFGDTYYAFEQGATPSKAYDLLKRARNSSQNGIRVIDNKVIAEREPRLELFSKSDIECLNDVIEEFGDAPFYVKAEAAHDAAYYKAWNKRTKDSEIMPIESIAELFANADDLIDYLSNRDADQLIAMPDTWCIYYISKCRQSIPIKDKLVVIVCEDYKPRGFFINTGLRPFIKRYAERLATQIPIKAANYKCLDHDSFIDCWELKEFDKKQLRNQRESLKGQAIQEIKKVVENSVTIDTRYINLILGR